MKWCKRCGCLEGELNPHNGKCEPMPPLRDDDGLALGPRCPVDAECEEWRIDECTRPGGCRIRHNQAITNSTPIP